MKLANVFVAAATVLLYAPATAQDWRTECVAEAGIQFDAPDRLERLPMQLGESSLYQRARLRPKDRADFVRAQYYWYCDVYVFSKKESTGDDVDLPPGVPPEMVDQLKLLLASMGGKRHKSFKSWLSDEDKVTIDVEGKPKRGKHGKLDYSHWVYRVKNGFGPCEITYCEAAVYDFPDREVALVIEMPLETERPGKPKSKWAKLIDRIIDTGRPFEPPAAELTEDAARDKFADTDAKRQALADAKKNITGLDGWDYFTQPNYIVLYSWDFTKPSERSKAKKDAEYYGERLEKMRQLYLASYPLDETGTRAVMPDPKSIPSLTGPVTGAKQEPTEEETAAEANKDELGVQPYSVFRLCATYDQFQKYGQSPPGVVGWYSPMSKELVVFLGGDQMMGNGATETVTYHEGWHQFADFYFHHPATPKHAELHRWFDEGHGDYFGSFRWGSNGWKYVGSKMRYDDCKQMVRAGDYVPFKELVHWDRRRFYSQRAPYYYAQAFSMIDFFRRGEKSRGWDPRWGEVLDMYRKVVLVKGDAKLAVDTAFRGFTDEDWKKLEQAWKDWVGGSHFMNGR